MEIKPTKDNIAKAMELKSEYLRLAFVNIVLLIFSMFLLITGRYIISQIAIIICFGYECYYCYQSVSYTHLTLPTTARV